MPSLPKCGVSRKIEDSKERRRLKRIVKELDEIGNGGVGFIVRTAGIEKSKSDLQRDRDYLKKIWEMIAQRVQVPGHIERRPAEHPLPVGEVVKEHFSEYIKLSTSSGTHDRASSSGRHSSGKK